jgi:ribonuclease Z
MQPTHTKYMEPRKVFWKKGFKIDNTQWVLSGYSRSMYRSGFHISGLNILLDAGPQFFKKPDYILITHSHVDHIAELPFTLGGEGKQSG